MNPLRHNSSGERCAGLAVDFRDGLRGGGRSGPTVVPGRPEASLLVRATRHQEDRLRMPEGEPRLEPEVVADFERWIREGAVDPRDEPPSAGALEELTSWEAIRRRRLEWWSFRPLAVREPPVVDDPASSEQAIDRFVGARLAPVGLAPTPEAPAAVLLRRAYFTLLGLPPTFEATAAFLGEVAGAGGADAPYTRLVDRLLASPHFGEKWARHWLDFPLPAPATLEILRGVPVRQRDCSFELTTPTGAALARTLAAGFGPMPPLEIRAVGYGAGDDRPGEIPNLLRVMIGSSASSCGRDRVVALEINIDDMTPEWLGHLFEELFSHGALDVTLTPVVMKKSRPGHVLAVLAPPGRGAALEEVLFRESTTFGIRRQEVDRLVLERRWVEVDTPLGRARVKLGERGGRVVSAPPEFDDLRELARRHRVPLREAHRLVLEAYHTAGRGQG